MRIKQPFLDYFNSVEPGRAACGMALQSATRQIVEDATDHEIFRNNPRLEILLDAGVRAVQSTPLQDSHGRVIGMLSAHYRNPCRPGPADLRKIDHFARHAARVIEWLMEKEKNTASRATRVRAKAQP